MSIYIPFHVLAVEESLAHGTVSRHLKLLVSLADKCSVLRLSPTNILHHLLDRFSIQLIINCKSQTARFFRNSAPQLLALLANASRKHQGIDFPIQRDVVTPNVPRDPIYKNLKGEFLISIGGGGNISKVRRTRQRLPS